MNVTPALIEERRRLGIDTYDEVWDGEYRVNPYPLLEHQRICTGVLVWLTPRLAHERGTLILGLNLLDAPSGWHNFRCPDLVFVAAHHEHILMRDGIRVEGPDALFEVRSPGDDTYKKFPFYAKLGVREVIVIDRNSKRPDVFRLRGAGSGTDYATIRPDADGWVLAQTMDVSFRWVQAGTSAVELRDERAPGASTRI